jgi:hypothetical protein
VEPRLINEAIDLMAERSHPRRELPVLKHGKEAAFADLSERNHEVVEAAILLTEGAPDVEVTSPQEVWTHKQDFHPYQSRVLRNLRYHNYAYGRTEMVTEYWKKVVVVMGDAKVTEVTPDHVLLCGVSTIRANPATTEPDPSTRAEFAFAIVRRDTADFYLNNPHELHNPKHPGKKLLTPESTRDMGGETVSQIGKQATHSKRSVYRWSLDGIKTEVKNSEKNIAQVLEAASNYELNSHLFGVEVEETPEPEPIIPKNLVNIINGVIGSGKKKKKQKPIDLDRPLTGAELIELDYRIETEYDLKLTPEELDRIGVVRDLAKLVIGMIDPERKTITEIVEN